MAELRYTLLTDGSSDDALIPVLSWLLGQHLIEHAFQAQWADLRKMPVPPRELPERIAAALDLYPCDVLFVHRDAERQSPADRFTEIRAAVASAPAAVPYVAVVPVRMMEAWMLFHEAALRRAAGNPNGRMPLALPALRTVENLSDPKDVLHTLLREASGLHGRRLRQFQASPRRVAGLIQDFSPLRELLAFQALEADVQSFAAAMFQP